MSGQEQRRTVAEIFPKSVITVGLSGLPEDSTEANTRAQGPAKLKEWSLKVKSEISKAEASENVSA